MLKEGWLVLLVVFSLAIIGAEAQQRGSPIPQLDVHCDFVNRPGQDPDEPPRVEVRWGAPSAEYVLIDGQRSATYGSVDGPGSWTFVAVGSGGIAFARKGCFIEAKTTNGLATQYKLTFDLLSPGAGSLKTTVTTKQTFEQIRRAVTTVLQAAKFAAAEATSVASEGRVYLYTPSFIPFAPASDDRIERQIALQVLVAREGNPSSRMYRVEVLPSMLKRFVREGGEWQNDPDTPDLGRSKAESVLKAIEAALDGH